LKKKLMLMVISILMFGVFIFTGCSKPSESKAEEVGKEFLTKLYKMESEKAKEILKAGDKIISAHDEFKPLTTEDQLKSMVQNRMYVRMIQFSEAKGSATKIQKLDLVKRSYDDKEKKITYDYTATIDVVYDKDNKKESTEEKGIISLVYENNAWKVYSNKVNKFSELLNN
jgi:hypothetical protein